jgi:hypothetical protein
MPDIPATLRRIGSGIWSWVKVTTFADSLLILFTAALTGASLYQFLILRGQLDVMRKDQRAWVAAVTGVPETPSSGTGRLLKIPIEIKNTGKTSARDVKVEVVARIVKNGDDPHCEYGNQVVGTSRATKVFLPNAPRTLYGVILSAPPNEKTPAQARVVSPDEIQQLTDGREFFIVYGRVSYRDIFNQQHWTHFCSWGSLSTKPAMFSSASCWAYNEIDDD